MHEQRSVDEQISNACLTKNGKNEKRIKFKFVSKSIRSATKFELMRTMFKTKLIASSSLTAAPHGL